MTQMWPTWKQLFTVFENETTNNVFPWIYNSPFDVNRFDVCLNMIWLTYSATGMDVPGCGGMNRLGGGKVFDSSWVFSLKAIIICLWRKGETFVQTCLHLIGMSGGGGGGGFGGMDTMGNMGGFGGRDMAPVGRMGGKRPHSLLLGRCLFWDVIL